MAGRNRMRKGAAQSNKANSRPSSRQSHGQGQSQYQYQFSSTAVGPGAGGSETETEAEAEAEAKVEVAGEAEEPSPAPAVVQVHLPNLKTETHDGRLAAPVPLGPAKSRLGAWARPLPVIQKGAETVSSAHDLGHTTSTGSDKEAVESHATSMADAGSVPAHESGTKYTRLAREEVPIGRSDLQRETPKAHVTGKSVFIGGLPFTQLPSPRLEIKLRQHLSRWASATSIKLVGNPTTGALKCGFAEFSSEAEAAKVLMSATGSVFEGHQLRIEISRGQRTVRLQSTGVYLRLLNFTFLNGTKPDLGSQVPEKPVPLDPILAKKLTCGFGPLEHVIDWGIGSYGKAVQVTFAHKQDACAAYHTLSNLAQHANLHVNWRHFHGNEARLENAGQGPREHSLGYAMPGISNGPPIAWSAGNDGNGASAELKDDGMAIGAQAPILEHTASSAELSDDWTASKPSAEDVTGSEGVALSERGNTSTTLAPAIALHNAAPATPPLEVPSLVRSNSDDTTSTSPKSQLMTPMSSLGAQAQAQLPTAFSQPMPGSHRFATRAPITPRGRRGSHLSNNEISIDRFSIWVGNLPPGCNEHEVRAVFAQSGTVNDVRLHGPGPMTHVRTTVATRAMFAFVTFNEPRAASDAIKNVNGQYFNGMRLLVRQRERRRFTELCTPGMSRKPSLVGASPPSLLTGDLRAPELSHVCSNSGGGNSLGLVQLEQHVAVGAPKMQRQPSWMAEMKGSPPTVGEQQLTSEGLPAGMSHLPGALNPIHAPHFQPGYTLTPTGGTANNFSPESAHLAGRTFTTPRPVGFAVSPHGMLVPLFWPEQLELFGGAPHTGPPQLQAVPAHQQQQQQQQQAEAEQAMSMSMSMSMQGQLNPVGGGGNELRRLPSGPVPVPAGGLPAGPPGPPGPGMAVAAPVFVAMPTPLPQSGNMPGGESLPMPVPDRTALPHQPHQHNQHRQQRDPNAPTAMQFSHSSPYPRREGYGSPPLLQPSQSAQGPNTKSRIAGVQQQQTHSAAPPTAPKAIRSPPSRVNTNGHGPGPGLGQQQQSYAQPLHPQQQQQQPQQHWNGSAPQNAPHPTQHACPQIAQQHLHESGPGGVYWPLGAMHPPPRLSGFQMAEHPVEGGAGDLAGHSYPPTSNSSAAAGQLNSQSESQSADNFTGPRVELQRWEGHHENRFHQIPFYSHAGTVDSAPVQEIDMPAYAVDG